MASFKTASALLLSLLAPSALALPSVRRQDACSGNPLEYKDLEVSEPYEGGYKMVPDLSCQSSEDQDCELTQGKAVAYTVEYSVGGGLGGAMDLGRILSFGLELGFGVAWSTTTETSTSTTGKCDPGGVLCGVESFTKLVHITGMAREPPPSDPFCFATGDYNWYPFDIVAPWTEGEGGSSLIITRACYLDCPINGNEEFCLKYMEDVPMPICHSELPSVKRCNGQKCAPPPAPKPDPGYRTGTCGIHVTQYQKPDPSKDSYSLEMTVVDAIGRKIGGTSGKVGPNHSLTSKLPWTVEVKTGGIDADPVRFAYAGFEWDSNSPNCSIGEYDSGDRDMDCTFQCTEPE